MKFSNKDLIVTLKTDTGVELEFDFDQNSVTVDGEASFSFENDAVNGIFVFAGAEFRSLYSLLHKAELHYVDIIRETALENDAENRLSAELSCPQSVGMI